MENHSPKQWIKKIMPPIRSLLSERSLTENYINGLGDDDRMEMAHFLNRRTEFKVLRTDYCCKVK